MWLGGAPLCSPSLTAAEPAAPGWTWASAATGRLTYDDNVYLQSFADEAERNAWVTTLSPQFALTWRSSDRASASFTYTPEWTRFASESSEDFVAHRLTASTTQPWKGATVEAGANATLVDGDDESLVWTGPGGAPATGAAAVRDRRDAAVYRGNLRLTWQRDRWTIRAAGALYAHDFQTAHRSTAGYQNFVDRGEISAGVDVGLRRGTATLFAGYRHGAQSQDRLLSYPEQYDNRFHRVLTGIEGSVAPWLRVSVALGPEFRRYGDAVHTSFDDRDGTNFYVDGTATITAAKGDSLVVLVKQFEQMSASGRGAYTDFTADLTWRHKFAKGTVLGAGVRGFRTDFLLPAVRDDWIVSEHVLVSVPAGRGCDIEASYTREDGISCVPATAGREYTRNLVSVAVKLRFE